MKGFNLKEFRPTIVFLSKFIGMYVLLNFLYGLYVSSFDPHPDPITSIVTDQAAFLLNSTGHKVKTYDYQGIPTTGITYKGKTVIGVYEGCNGVNTAIIFMAFIIAFGPLARSSLWFLPTGLAIIHSCNLARIVLLFYVATYRPHAMYFTHKYLFTASLYAVIFLLWLWWIRKYSAFKPTDAHV